MRRRLLATLGAAALSASVQTQAQTYDNVSFDCTGTLTEVLDTDAGVRATGNVELSIDLPDGATWDSAGIIVINLPPQAAGRDVGGRPLRRCRGTGQLEATVVDVVKGVDIYELTLMPTQIQVRVGNRRITDPTAVGFTSSAGGDPNV